MIRDNKIEGEPRGITFSDERPWIGPGAGMGTDPSDNYMPPMSEALLAIGDLLPPPPDKPPTDFDQSDGEPAPMSEEAWLRELAKRISRHAEKFGGVDRQVRRELDLAARCLAGYAVWWERANESNRERGGE